MIIQINATVCAAVDNGDDRRHKIAGSDQLTRRRDVGKGASDQEKEEIKGCAVEMPFLRGDGGWTMPRVLPSVAQVARGRLHAPIMALQNYAAADPWALLRSARSSRLWLGQR
jgi:hypothetical protein